MNKVNELVKIQDPKNKGDYLLLNKAEFDAKKHKLFKEATPKEEAAK